MDELEMNCPCPHCGGAADIVGGRNEVDYIQCACGYSGDHWEEDGVIYDIDIPLADIDAYVHRVQEITADPANIALAERTRAARRAEWEKSLGGNNDALW